VGKSNFRAMIEHSDDCYVEKRLFWRIFNVILLNYLKEISQFFEGNFGQNKDKKRIFWSFKVEALIEIRKIENIHTATIRKKEPFVKCFFLNILPKSVDIEVQKHAKRLDDYLL
jgi:hypothetical protein